MGVLKSGKLSLTKSSTMAAAPAVPASVRPPASLRRSELLTARSGSDGKTRDICFSFAADWACSFADKVFEIDEILGDDGSREAEDEVLTDLALAA